ncbi:hypothetical protein niasHS_010563 [Heterodera schachtii]|uniref:Galactosylgalactosylxylosylprotein 3-beta-glucuronosyltransferase n=1 Tax=Heterodera schachtii TaxID=97005 RepID=A0ABD2ITW2_HETSC
MVITLCILTLFQFCFYTTKIMELSATSRQLEAEIFSMRRKREALQGEIDNLISSSKSAERGQSGRRRMHFTPSSPPIPSPLSLPPIFFITPTSRRVAQKADLTRLGQTLVPVANLFWIIVEDSEHPSPFIGQMMGRLGIVGIHLAATTPSEWKNKFPKGVAQRNAALNWLRENKAAEKRGVVYFGDDDNAYDWRLFAEMRSIRQIGIWPVGIVDQMIAEYPLIGSNSKVFGFNSKWKRQRPFPIDMASFAVNISRILTNAGGGFSYQTPRGYLESHFLISLNVTINEFEAKADNCTKVFVWHTRTEPTALLAEETAKFASGGEGRLDETEKDAVG